MDMELISNVIILATALVGLYMALKSMHNKSVKNEAGTDVMNGNNDSIFKPLLNMAGIFIFMLAFPAFIWAYTSIIQNMSSSSETEEKTEIVIPFELRDEKAGLELMFVAANNIPNTNTRGKALSKVVGFSLAENNFKMATIAASAIPNTSVKGEQLNRVVEAMVSIKNSGVDKTRLDTPSGIN